MQDFLQAECPSCRPTNSVMRIELNELLIINDQIRNWAVDMLNTLRDDDDLFVWYACRRAGRLTVW